MLPRKEITRNHIKQKTVRLAICVDIEYLIHNSIDLDDDDYEYNYLNRLNLDSLNKTMSEIEKATDGALDDILEGIHLNYQGRLFRVNYITEPKVLFKEHAGVHRCFVLLIRPDYQAMPSNPKLTIKLKKESGHIFYLLTENENLNHQTFQFSGRTFKKRVARKLKQSKRCVNYRERYGNCTGRLHCVESCVNREALKKFEKIPIGEAVVDKDQFSLEEWNTTYSMKNSEDIRIIYQNLNEECGNKFRDEPPCVEVMFKGKIELIPSDEKTKVIDLFLDFELSIEEFTWFKLLLDILNIQSISSA